MNKIRIVLSFWLLICSYTALAQDLKGFYIQMGLGYERNSVDSANADVTDAFGDALGTASVPSVSSGRFPGVISVGYVFKDVVGKAGLMIGMDGGIASRGTMSSSSEGVTFGQQLSNRYSFFVAPTLPFENGGLAYLKLGYSTQQLVSTDSSGDKIGQGTVHGYILGLGYKQVLWSNYYGFGELNYTKYAGYSSSKVLLSSGSYSSGYSPKSSTVQGLIGFGYNF